MTLLQVCERCGQYVKAQEAVWVILRLQSGQVLPSRVYHHDCAPLVDGKLPPPGVVCTVPYPAVRNVRRPIEAGVEWVLYRKRGDTVRTRRVVLDHAMLRRGRDYAATLLRRARRQLRNLG